MTDEQFVERVIERIAANPQLIERYVEKITALLNKVEAERLQPPQQK